MSVFSYYVGVDLGQAQDYTAITLLEEPVYVPEAALDPDRSAWAWKLNISESGWVSPQSLTPYQLEQVLSINYYHGRPPDVPLFVRHLERFQDRYSKVSEKLVRLFRTPVLRNKRVALLVDKTGVGAGVVELMRQAGLHPVPITITGGSSVTPDPSEAGGHRVPKRDLIGSAQVLFQNGRLKIAEDLPEAETLRRELANFKLKVNINTGHDSYEAWREGDHDDLVLSTSLACWFREWWMAHVDLEYAIAR